MKFKEIWRNPNNNLLHKKRKNMVLVFRPEDFINHDMSPPDRDSVSRYGLEPFQAERIASVANAKLKEWLETSVANWNGAVLSRMFFRGEEMKFVPDSFHEVYLKAAQRLGWPIRPEVAVPYEQLDEAAKALDIALADFCNAKLKEWLDAAPTVYGNTYKGMADQSTWSSNPNDMTLDLTDEFARKAKLVDIRQIDD